MLAEVAAFARASVAVLAVASSLGLGVRPPDDGLPGDGVVAGNEGYTGHVEVGMMAGVVLNL